MRVLHSHSCSICSRIFIFFQFFHLVELLSLPTRILKVLVYLRKSEFNSVKKQKRGVAFWTVCLRPAKHPLLLCPSVPSAHKQRINARPRNALNARKKLLSSRCSKKRMKKNIISARN